MTATVSGCTPRVERLRERVLDTRPSVSAERGLLVTEAYELYAADPPVLRRAKALARVLDHMTIYVDEGELITGNQASAPRAAPLFPEYAVDFLVDEIDEFPRRRADVYTVSDEVKRVILDRIGPVLARQNVVRARKGDAPAGSRSGRTDRRHLGPWHHHLGRWPHHHEHPEGVAARAGGHPRRGPNGALSGVAPQRHRVRQADLL